MQTAAEAKAFRRRLVRGLEDAETRRYRARVAELREQAKRARVLRKEKLLTARILCDAEVQHAKAEADKAYRIAMEKARDARRAKKRAARKRCQIDRDAVKLEAAIAIRDAERERAAEKAHRDELARIERSNRTRRRSSAVTSAKERREESDEQVLNDIPHHLHPLFRKVRGQIKASPRRTRTEAFLEYVHENPDAWLETIDEDALARQFQAEEHRLAKTRHPRPGATRRAASGDEAPF